MSDLIFGIVWTSITTLCFIPFFISLFASKSFSGPSALFVFLFFALFYSIGIWMLTRGIKKIKKDKATEKNGIYTYGKVIRIGRTGTYVNGCPELKAKIATYIPQERRAIDFDEIIGFAPAKYNIGDYLILQYYDGDVNIIEKTMPNNLPIDQKEMIDSLYPTTNSEDEIIIDGVKYRRVADSTDASPAQNNNSFNSDW